MQRFLEEPERPLFTANDPYNDGTMHPFPRAEYGSPTYVGSVPYSYALPRFTSPSNSGPTSSYISSDWSDRQSTPISSPDPSVATCSPEMSYTDNIPHGYGGHWALDNVKHNNSGPGVALHEIQTYADAQTENTAFDDDQSTYATYASYAQEGYQPLQSNAESVTNGLPNGTKISYGEEHAPDSPNLRRRRAQTTRSITSPHLPSKVSKRPVTTKRSSSYQASASTNNCVTHSHFSSNRAFPCPFAIYGCGSTFGSKNEWKRHVNTQHMKLGFWRCDQCNQSERKPNDFNRKDLFIQHVRRMHPLDETKPAKTAKTASPRSAKKDPEEQEMAATAARCFRHIRSPPEQSSCLFCEVQFNGASTWDERLEHIGRHMETAKKESEEPIDPQEWQQDVTLEEWLAQEGIIARSGKHWVLADGRA